MTLIRLLVTIFINYLYFNSRKILLLSKVFNNKINKDLKNKSWLVTLGDWDIFRY